MPELPEVEAARRALEAHCLGRKIARCAVANDTKVVVGASGADFQAALAGKTIVAARRRGKNLWLALDSPPFPSFQFGMAGAIYIKGIAVTKYKRSAVSSTDEWPSKYSKLFFELDDGTEFSFTDKRRFARVRLLQDPECTPPISELGPDALFEPMHENDFVDSLSKKKLAIKALLLDQSFISGIGNWIADEVLFQARIHPLQIASSMSRENCEELYKCINEVIKYSVEVDADADQFPSNWLFHYRWGKKPGKVDGMQIKFITAGGRTTAFVPEIQKLTGSQPNEPRRVKSRNVKRSNSPESSSTIEGNGDDEIMPPKERKARASGAAKQQDNNKKEGGVADQAIGAQANTSLRPRRKASRR